mmetsp:Transcript_16274/g.52073  ORF Transcript_16274/g.52073 Transcript_16274/m.52073 type:complete len:217 (+) Transcript_16274:1099-1749(+)
MGRGEPRPLRQACPRPRAEAGAGAGAGARQGPSALEGAGELAGKHEALQQWQRLQLREVREDELHVLGAASGQQEPLAEHKDGRRQDSHELDRAEADDAVPEREHLLGAEVAHEAAHDPGEGLAQWSRVRAERRQVEADVGHRGEHQRLEERAQGQQRGGLTGDGVQLAQVPAVECSKERVGSFQPVRQEGKGTGVAGEATEGHDAAGRNELRALG